MLHGRNLQIGDRVLLAYLPGIDFIPGFFGCLLAGVVPVPIAALKATDIQRDRSRFHGIAEDCGSRIVLTQERYRRHCSANHSDSDELEWVATDTLEQAEGQWEHLADDPDRPLYLQYTSGSTSFPRGVKISLKNLCHNLEITRRDSQVNRDSVLVSWLPHYHDLGLVAGVLQTAWAGAHLVMLSPMTFVRKPILWLQTIQRYRATHTSAPNFAFERVMRRADDDEFLELDLSTLRVITQGGDVLQADTVLSFADRLSRQGAPTVLTGLQSRTRPQVGLSRA